MTPPKTKPEPAAAPEVAEVEAPTTSKSSAAAHGVGDYAYRFTGGTAETFASIALVNADGEHYTLVAEPGDLVNLEAPTHHARLDPTNAAARDAAAAFAEENQPDDAGEPGTGEPTT